MPHSACSRAAKDAADPVAAAKKSRSGHSGSRIPTGAEEGARPKEERIVISLLHMFLWETNRLGKGGKGVSDEAAAAAAARLAGWQVGASCRHLHHLGSPPALPSVRPFIRHSRPY